MYVKEYKNMWLRKNIWVYDTLSKSRKSVFPARTQSDILLKLLDHKEEARAGEYSKHGKQHYIFVRVLEWNYAFK
jgi:hypothetical protein